MNIQTIKFFLKNVFQEAHLLEHAISQDVENAIEKLLNYPDKYPFGQDIPGSKKTEKINIIPLSKTTKNKSYTISKIPPENPEFVDFLHTNKILLRRPRVLDSHVKLEKNIYIYSFI